MNENINVNNYINNLNEEIYNSTKLNSLVNSYQYNL